MVNGNSGVFTGLTAVFAIALWVVAIVLLVKYWAILPSWAKVVGLLGVLPVVTIIVVKNQK